VTPDPHQQPPLSAFGVARAGFALIFSFIRAQRLAFAIAATGAVLFTSAIVASAFVIGHITDTVIVPVMEGGEPIGSKLTTAVALILGVALWKAIGIIIRRSAAGWLQARTQRNVKQRLIEHQFGLTLGWYASRGTGDLLSVADNDTRQATFVLAPLPFATGVAFLLVGSVAVLTWTDVWVGLAGLVLLAIVVGLDVRGSWKTFERMEEAQRRRGQVGDTAHESFDGALTVKALGREDVEADRFRDAAASLRDQLVDVGRTWTAYRAFTEGLPPIGTVLIVLIGTYRVASGDLTAGELVRIAYLLALLAVPIRLIGYLMWDLAESTAAWRRVQDVLDVEDAVVYGDVDAAAGEGPAPLDAAGVGFGYDGTPILHDVAFELAPGRTLAVVGPTGSGKSTLTLLLARLWDPTTGAIRVAGRDLRSLARGAVPAEIAYVSQDTFLFDDTVTGNIALGAPIGHDAVVDAARLAGADGFVTELPQGYDTHVGERGTTLSGGQRQRIALARALARQPRVLVLDDATSALDPTVEAAILRRLRDAALPSTVVVVAYRRSSIVLADEVAYVEDGRVVAHGTHDQLLATVPGYARLLEAYDEDAAERARERDAVSAGRGGERR
jgi:ATP-binding cassette, subfamily B, bacterial